MSVTGLVTCVVLTDASNTTDTLSAILAERADGNLIGQHAAACFIFPSVLRATKFAVETIIEHKLQMRAAVCVAEVDTELEMLGLLDRTLATATVADYGQVTLSMSAQDLVRDRLPSDYEFDELGTYQLGGSLRAERLYVARHPQLPEVTRELPMPAGPGMSECFVGRAQDTDDLKAMLVQNPLTTLHGTGGVGKTALARRVYIEISDQYDAAYWIDVQSLTRDTQLLAHLSHAIDAVANLNERPIDAMIRVIGERNVLLVIDGAERLTKGLAPIVESLVANCPNLQILVCSQRKLGAKGERLMYLKGLEYPINVQDPILLKEYDAVGMFLERVQMRDPKFRIVETNAKDIARIVERLEGIPLSIEIIASKVGVLSPRQILSRLDNQLAFYEDKKRSGNQRHRGLRSAIDWTHDVLSEPAQVLFRRLSIIRGAFSADFAQMTVIDDRLTSDQVNQALEELADVNMIVPVPGEKYEKWFMLVPALALYASEKLRASGETDLVRCAYRKWLVDFLDRVNEGIHHPDQPLWLERIESIYEDVRETILNAAKNKEGREWIAKILVGFQGYWYRRDDLHEGMDMMRRLIHAEGMDASSEYAYICLVGASMASQRGVYDEARTYAHLGYRIARQRSQPLYRAMAYFAMGTLYCRSGNPKKSAAFYGRALPVLRELREYRRLYNTLTNRAAMLIDCERFEGALACYREAEDIAPILNDPESKAFILNNIAFLGYRMGNLRLWRDSLAKFGQEAKQFRSPSSLANALLTASKGLVALEQYESAALAFGMALVTLEECKSRGADLETAIRLSREMLEAGMPRPDLDRLTYEGKQAPLDDRWDFLRSLSD